ncbi:hypothetical protein EBZ80_24605 [bacterium]|nr:hypothetical protein [bacterium]
MPTIELTDEQAQELKDLLFYEIEKLDEWLPSYAPHSPDHVTATHEKSVLSDILNLLEIA